MKKDILDKVLLDHKRWLEDRSLFRRADLSDIDLAHWPRLLW